MNIALQITANLTIVFEPFLPFTSNKLTDILGVKLLKWDAAGKNDLMNVGHVINKAELLFSKIENDKIEDQIAKLERATKANTKFPPMKDEVTFDDFTKMDIRVGEIITAEKVEKADKLLKLTVNTGLDIRTIVSGIAEHYSPEDLVGQKVTILMNLAPRKIRGVESQGMILMAEDDEGKLSFVAPTKEMEAGGEVR